MIIDPVVAAASPEVPMNDGLYTLESGAVYGNRPSTTTGLTWGYYGGRWGGFSIVNSVIALTNSADNYNVVARATGLPTCVASAVNWNNTIDYGRVYKISTANSVVASTQDHRSGPYGIFTPPQPSVNTAAVGNITTGEDDLITFVMPAGTFNAAGKGVRITAWGICANNANAKTLILYFGTVAILTTALTANQAGVWRISAEVISTGSSAQAYIAQLVQGGTATLVDAENGTLSQNDAASITIKCTGTATSTDDIIQKGLVVTYINGSTS